MLLSEVTISITSLNLNISTYYINKHVFKKERKKKFLVITHSYIFSFFSFFRRGAFLDLGEKQKRVLRVRVFIAVIIALCILNINNSGEISFRLFLKK